MPYTFLAFLSVSLFAAIHLFAKNLYLKNSIYQTKFLSIGSGVAIAYVFVDILPKLSKNDFLITQAITSVFPYFEKHVYVMALLGFLLFFSVDRSKGLAKKHYYFYLSLASYAFLNFLVGYAVVDKNNPEVKPLFLFTIAMGLHYFMNDYTLTKEHGKEYNRFAKWILISCLFIGWAVGAITELSSTAVALISAFIGGGVIMNVTRHELGNENQDNLALFIFATCTYTVILLLIG